MRASLGGIDRFPLLAVAVTLVDNDPKGAQRFADDSTVYDSLSFGGTGSVAGSCSALFWLVVHMTGDKNSHVRNVQRALDREVQNVAPLSPWHSLPGAAGSGCGCRILGRHVDTVFFGGVVFFYYFFPLVFFFPLRYLNFFPLSVRKRHLFHERSLPVQKGLKNSGFPSRLLPLGQMADKLYNLALNLVKNVPFGDGEI